MKIWSVYYGNVPCSSRHSPEFCQLAGSHDSAAPPAGRRRHGLRLRVAAGREVAAEGPMPRAIGKRRQSDRGCSPGRDVRVLVTVHTRLPSSARQSRPQNQLVTSYLDGPNATARRAIFQGTPTLPGPAGRPGRGIQVSSWTRHPTRMAP